MASKERTNQPNELENEKPNIAAAPGKKLTPQAKRALAEAAERRRKKENDLQNPAKELGGPKGEEPVRYGDWEKGGIAWDF
ncbi:MAG: DUF1674 domain-containing protein [Hyphomicrobiaceae bacterium]